MPASTSPEPAVASQGGALALIASAPVGGGDDGVGALQDDDRAGAGGGGAGAGGLRPDRRGRGTAGRTRLRAA